MSMPAPQTEALSRFIAGLRDPAAISDLMFLEGWEAKPSNHIGMALRARQVGRANPSLAAAIRAELDHTVAELACAAE